MPEFHLRSCYYQVACQRQRRGEKIYIYKHTYIEKRNIMEIIWDCFPRQGKTLAANKGKILA